MIAAAAAAACAAPAADATGAYVIAMEPETSGVVEGQLYLFQTDTGDYAALLQGSDCKVTTEPEKLVLNACNLFPEQPPNRFEAEGPIFDDFVLTRSDDGQLSGEVTGRDDRSVLTHGRVLPSTRTPTLRKRVGYSPWTARPTLAWDLIEVDFGDDVGLEASTLRQQLTASSESHPTLDARWLYYPYTVANSDHEVVFSARASIPWPSIDGEAVTFSLPEGTADAGGHSTDTQPQLRVPVARSGEPTRGWLFDADSMPALTWGGVRRIDGTPECEGSCLQLGPRLVACAEPGIAGRLDTREASKLVVRVRAAVQPSARERLRLAVYLGAAIDADVPAALDETLTADSSADEWHNLEIPLSAEQRVADLPFELRPIYSCPWTWTTGGPPPPPSTDATILIDAITLE